ncbi:MAG: FCD domain-containing protein, partial [Acidimicrobiales bacterium]
NTALHRRITELARNQVLADLIARLERRIRWSFVLLGHPRQGHVAEHTAVVEALAAGDGDGAASAMRLHIEATRRAYRESFSTYFGDAPS